jgi:hypothetical protein
MAMLLAISLSVGAQSASKPRPGPNGSWRLLGQVTAGSGNDHDIIIVAGPYDYFRRLKFKVTNSPLEMYRMVVTYQDGFPEKIETRFRIEKGGESRVIDLKGGKRKLKTVEFWYESKGMFNGRADVTLFGMK